MAIAFSSSSDEVKCNRSFRTWLSLVVIQLVATPMLIAVNRFLFLRK
jgi:hypothetical protein